MKPGYKRTLVGLIPEEWDTQPLGDYVCITSGESPSLFHFTTSGVPYFKVEQLGNVEKYLDGLATPYFFLKGKTVPRGSVIFAKRGAAIALNKIRILSDDSFMDTNLMALTPAAGLDSDYLYYTLAQIGLWKLADTTSVPQINNKHIKPLIFPIPRLIEQRAIGAALSDVDALLAGLDRLLAKKRDLKQATMQQLLTGRTRLPGFNGEWKAKRLGDVAEIVMGQSPSSANYNLTGDGLPLIQGNADISNRKTIERSFTTQITKRGNAGDILMSVRAPVGEVSRATFDVCLGRGVCAIRSANDFLYHCLIFLEPSWGKHSKGSTFDSITSSDARAFEINLPLDVAEQTAIAAVLNDMDGELAALEARRSKTQVLKQAMMQELLTGKTRLVVTEVAHA